MSGAHVISGTRVSRDSCVRGRKGTFPRTGVLVSNDQWGRGSDAEAPAVVAAPLCGRAVRAYRMRRRRMEDGRIDLVSRTRVTQIPFLRRITRVAILNFASYRQVQEYHIIAAWDLSSC